MSKARSFAKLPGFRDFPPEDLALRNHLFETWRKVSRLYGFSEYDGPPLEALELYTEKSGSEIAGQLYEFQDKGGRDVAMRPEMTPSLARILGERSRAMPKPIRWFSVPQLFRYERQQRGRLREHFQWNVDLVGEAGPEGDAEVLGVALAGLRELGLGPADIHVRVSDRVLLSRILQSCGVPEDRLPAAYAVIDKLERDTPERLEARLRDPNEVGLTAVEARRILDLFEEPDLTQVEVEFGNAQGVSERMVYVRTYLGALSDLGLSEFVSFDLKIVRGLAYYTGIVFEVFDRQGEFRAICGGGRYDRLLEWAGGDALPAVGFGMGDVVLGELLKERGLVPEYRREVDFFIVSIGDEQMSPARRIGRELREAGFSVVYPLRSLSVRKQFAGASSEGARRVVILGPEEIARNVAMVRDMASGTEEEVPLDRLTARGGIPSTSSEDDTRDGGGSGA